ncbi:hypothetical protein [Arthrobacter sp. SX1312]|uniref:hypothetical protein n=1 Tax=Arthrobacter sp. SX1312 TaxID=2058896 RepID=UPI0011B02EE3|nr:hypothetical protein [Arthrobacter sp. SX1312]
MTLVTLGNRNARSCRLSSANPEAQTRSHLEALTKPPLFERVYTPADCAPDTAFTPPPAELEGVLGRSNLNDDRSTLRVEIYTAPDEGELGDYFVGAHPDPSARCTDFSVIVNDIKQDFSYTRADVQPITPRSTWASTGSRRTAPSPTT